MSDPLDISQRKRDHLALCAGTGVNFIKKTTLLEQVELMHCALPDTHLDEMDTRVQLFGKWLEAPIMIAGMTGGTEVAGRINHDLAQLAEELGLGFGVGSQRAMLERPDTSWTFEVRKAAPRALVLGNIGLVQARAMRTDQVRSLCDQIGADALCVHLNPAMEIVQPGGDRDFTGGAEALARLCSELGLPVVAKETGCGFSRKTGRKLVEAGVSAIDVGGAGGTSWVAVEAHRATDEESRLLADELWDWGIPTAASLVQLGGLTVPLIATGGVRSGLDAARAIALGAGAVGLAAPVLKAYRSDGLVGARALLQRLMKSLRNVMFLTGSRSVAELQKAELIMSPDLARWVPGGSMGQPCGRRP